ncbi:hypothetical protein Tco_1469687 [Tanacetum coccineum]
MDITTDASLVATQDSDNISRTQTMAMPKKPLGVLLLRLVSHEPQTEANIEQILPSLSTYQRKHIKTQKHRRAKKGTELPQTSVPLDLEADEAVYKEGGDSVERAITTDASLVAAQDSDNIIRTQTTAMPNVDIPQGMDTGDSTRRQETMGGAPAQTRSERVLKQPNEPPIPEDHTSGSGEGRMEHTFELIDIVPPTPYDSPLLGGYTPGSDEGRLKLEELMAMCTKLSKQVESTDDDLDKEGASKQGRTNDKTKPMFKDSDFDDLDDLVDEGMTFVQEKDAENQVKIGADDTEVVTQKQLILLVRKLVLLHQGLLLQQQVFDDEDITMAIAQTLIKMKEEKAKEKGVAIKDVEDSSRPIKSITTLQPLPTIDPKDKGKGILQETKPVEKTKKKVQGDAQIERDAEVALRLQVELDEELRVERERQEEASKVAIAEMFDEV